MRVSQVLAALRPRWVLSMKRAIATGFRSGEQAGRNRTRHFCRFNRAADFRLLWVALLSGMTTPPGPSRVSMQVSNAMRAIAPLVTQGAIRSSQVNTAMNVWVCPRPNRAEQGRRVAVPVRSGLFHVTARPGPGARWIDPQPMPFDQRTAQCAQGHVGFSGHDLDQKQHMRRLHACGAGPTPNTRAAVRQECPAAMWSNTRCRKSFAYALPMRHPLSDVHHTSGPVGIPREPGQTHKPL